MGGVAMSGVRDGPTVGRPPSGLEEKAPSAGSLP
jgi:hypothetical protein